MDGITVTTPNPADAGSGAVVAAASPELPIAPISPCGAKRPSLVDRIFRRLSEGSGFLIVGSLPGTMYDQTSAGAGSKPVPTDRLWGAALTPILIIAVLNIGARAITKMFAPKKS